MMDEAEIKEKELTLASLRSDTITVAEQLTVLLQEKKDLEESIAIQRVENETAIKQVAKALKDLEDERARMRMERKAHEDWTLRAKRELEVVKQQKKEALSELARINEWIFSGENKKRELEGQIEDLQEQLKDKKAIETAILDLLAERDIAEADRSAVKLETQLARDEAEVALTKIQAELSEAQTSLTEAIKQRESETVKLNDLKNQRVQLKKDTDIVIARIEAKYEEAFPGLKLNL